MSPPERRRRFSACGVGMLRRSRAHRRCNEPVFSATWLEIRVRSRKWSELRREKRHLGAPAPDRRSAAVADRCLRAPRRLQLGVPRRSRGIDRLAMPVVAQQRRRFSPAYWARGWPLVDPARRRLCELAAPSACCRGLVTAWPFPLEPNSAPVRGGCEVTLAALRHRDAVPHGGSCRCRGFGAHCDRTRRRVRRPRHETAAACPFARIGRWLSRASLGRAPCRSACTASIELRPLLRPVHVPEVEPERELVQREAGADREQHAGRSSDEPSGCNANAMRPVSSTATISHSR
jgi:hypothetical protein